MRLIRNEARKKRKKRIRKKVFGTSERPRLVVFRSNRYIYAQIINDEEGHTYVASSSLSLLEAKGKSLTKDIAKLVGLDIAKKALDKNIKKVVFDRNGYKYHGRVKALADGAREGGLEF